MSNCKQHRPEHQGNHVELRAADLVVGTPEIGTPWTLENVSPERLFKAPKRHKRCLSDARLIKRIEDATGRKATGVTYHPGGARTVEIGDRPSQGEEGKERARWREAINGWREAVSREKTNH